MPGCNISLHIFGILYILLIVFYIINDINISVDKYNRIVNSTLVAVPNICFKLKSTIHCAIQCSLMERCTCKYHTNETLNQTLYPFIASYCHPILTC